MELYYKKSDARRVSAGLEFLKSKEGATIIFNSRSNETGSEDAQALGKLLSDPMDSRGSFVLRFFDLCSTAHKMGINVQVLDDTTVSFTP